MESPAPQSAKSDVLRRNTLEAWFLTDEAGWVTTPAGTLTATGCPQVVGVIRTR